MPVLRREPHSDEQQRVSAGNLNPHIIIFLVLNPGGVNVNDLQPAQALDLDRKPEPSALNLLVLIPNLATCKTTLLHPSP